MAISKKTRILILIAVDTIFFMLEIIIGYTAHSLALVADAFHMLNDIISLCVGYWATDVAENKSSSNEYTYGWARAEILGGLINGVFLIALCVTIILDAIQRFFEVQEVSNPKLVLIVGGIGLAFNIMGLFLFHDHSHSHGGHSHGEEDGHSHDHAHAHSHDELSHAEAGHADHLHSAEEEEVIAHGKNGEAGNGVADKSKNRTSVTFNREDSTTSSHSHSHSQSRTRKESMTSRNRRHSRSYSTIEDLPIHPASLRQDMRTKARFGDAEEADYYLEEEEDTTTANEPSEVTEASPLLKKAGATTSRRRSNRLSKQGGNGNDISAVDHSGHKHSTAPKASSGGHGHDENVRGMFLHVLGDALGNVGVMASALIIWQSHWKYRFYFDPAISLFITLIILKSAIPLVRDTARPLLQATPENIQVEDIRADIESLPGIVSCHHIHVWALTRDKLVATLDVQLDFNFEGESGAKRYMELAAAIKSCLRGHNIYSSTVQPEFCMNKDHMHVDGGGGGDSGTTGTSDSSSSKDTVVPYQDGGNSDAKKDANGPPCEHGECLLADSRHGGMQCCMPGSGAVTPKKGVKSGGGGGHGHAGHDHDHDHGHEH